jgi:hypothetical protein
MGRMVSVNGFFTIIWSEGILSCNLIEGGGFDTGLSLFTKTGKGGCMRALIVVLSVALLALGPLGCQKKEGPAEKAGKQIDQAVEKAEKKLDEAAGKLKDTAEKIDKNVNQKVKSGTEKAAQELEDTGKAVQEKVDK